MKTLKIISTALALVIAISFNAFAQVQSGSDEQTADVQVYASAFDALEIDNGDELGAGEAGNVNFGNIILGLPATIQAGTLDSEADDNVGDGYHTGILTITGSPVEVTIEVTNAVLNDGDSQNDTDFTTKAYFTFADGSSGASSAITATANQSVTLSGNAGDILEIGGTLDAIQNPGHYSTEDGTPVTVTVSYN